MLRHRDQRQRRLRLQGPGLTDPAAPGDLERPLPFALRLATRLTTETAPRYEDGAIVWRCRAGDRALAKYHWLYVRLIDEQTTLVNGFVYDVLGDGD